MTTFKEPFYWFSMTFGCGLLNLFNPGLTEIIEYRDGQSRLDWII